MSRHGQGGHVVDPVAAGNFAAAVVVSVLDSADWQISQDVDAGMSDMVGQLGGATELTVLVHRDSVELVAALYGRMQHRVVPARTAFSTTMACAAG